MVATALFIHFKGIIINVFYNVTLNKIFEKQQDKAVDKDVGVALCASAREPHVWQGAIVSYAATSLKDDLHNYHKK